MTPAELNALPENGAREAFARCCGASAWVSQMVSARPFASAAQVLDVARERWESLGPPDRREAFAHHPRIGDLESLQRKYAASADLASREQAGVSKATRAVLEALAEGNRAYEQRFGYIFIVFASGKSAEEMLELLKNRLGNEPAAEIGIAGKEQWKIMRLRLEQLLDSTVRGS
jgi:2-oxo-4-hydroxy-4-carboxy-5-ureidoimidazoline decarboxylase